MKTPYQPPVNAVIIACLFLTFMFLAPAHAQFFRHGEHHFPELHPDFVVRLNHNTSQMEYEPGELLVRFQDELELPSGYHEYKYFSDFADEGRVDGEWPGLDSDAGDYFAGGSGTEADPYLIETAYHLDNIRYFTGEENTNKFFKQIADVDLGVAPWNVEEGWLPIGHSQDEAYFMGNYNGNGYKIHNLTINRSNESNIGLFGYVVDAEILNLTLVNVDIQGGSTVGSIAGRSHYLTITGSKSSGTITGFGNWVGGLTGTLFNSNISKSFSSVNVLGYGFSIGGLSGTLNNSTIENSYFAGSVNGLRNVGGITGRISDSSVITSYSSGMVVSTSGVLVGGLIGFGSGDFDASTSYWNIETSAQANCFGGIPKTTSQMLQQNTFSNWNFDDVWNINSGNTYPHLQWQEEVYDFNYPPDFVPPSNLTAGLAETGVYLSWDAPSMGNPTAYSIYRDSVLIDDVSGETNYNDTGVEYYNTYSYHITAVYGANQSQQSNTVSIYFFEGFEGGDGTEENPYLIANAEQLNAVRYNLTSHFKQIADIDLDIEPYNSGAGWPPIGHWQDANQFRGSYNGNGHVIDGLFINRPEATQQGLFGTISDASISGVKLTNVDITAEGLAGGLVSESANSQISNCMTSGVVSGSGNSLGGLIGFSSGLTVIENCFSEADVFGFSMIGGLAGVHQVNSSVKNSYSMGNVNGNSRAGGLIGVVAASGNVYDSYSAGSVTGNSEIGGLIGSEFSVSNVVNSFWDVENSGQNVSAGGEGKSTAEMTSLITFTNAGWDFKGLGINEVWNIHEGVNNAYPFLNWFAPGTEAPTDQIIPAVFTEEVVAIDMSSATILAGITNIGNPAATQHGVCWNTSGNPTLDDDFSEEGPVSNAGYYTSVINGLTVNTLYFVRAYAINDEGVHYGNELSFITFSMPEGEGTPENPYLVANLADLFWLSWSHDEWDKHFLQVDDINATETKFWNGGKGWTPIGTNDHPFSGYYSGDGKTIRGLFVNRPYTSHVGLFGVVNQATINELGLIMADVTGQNTVGGLAGLAGNNTGIESCFISGNVSGRGGLIGGLIGQLFNNSTVINSYNVSKVSGLTAGSTGRAGLIGTINRSSVIYCYSAGSTWGYNVSGLISFICSESSVQNSYWDTETSGVSSSGGGYGRTTAEMTFPYDPNTYVNWDFENIWSADEDHDINDGYPHLSCFGLVGPQFYTLTLLANPDGINTTLTGAGDYKEGESVTVSASEVEGYTFMNWKDASGNIISYNLEHSFYMPAENLTLIANFEIDVLVKELSENNILVFPNPAGIVFSIASDIHINSIVITDVFGKTVYREMLNNTHGSISVNGFDSGLYFVRFFTDDGVFVRKLQVQE